MKLRVFDYKTNKMFKVLNICFEGTPTVTIQYNPVIKFRFEKDLNYPENLICNQCSKSLKGY